MEGGGQQQQPSANDNAYWIQPPPSTSAEDHHDVAMHVLIWKIGPIDTVAGCADISISVEFEWSDTRIVGWVGELPPKLWGPRVYLSNMLGEITEKHVYFQITDPQQGRLRRGISFIGLVDNPMSLRDFPFDQQTVRVHLVSAQNFATVDGTTGFGTVEDRQYKLRHAGGPTGTGLSLMTWTGEIAEWNLHGIAAKFVAGDAKAVIGGMEMSLSLLFVISRQTPYYFWKVLLPLYLVTALSFTAFHYDTDDLTERSALTSSYFLASFAMLYVVGDSLPKTHFLTRVDKLIVSTIMTISLSGLLSRLIFSVHQRQGKEVAEKLNQWIEVSLVALYTISNLWAFGPPFLKMRKHFAKLAHAEQPPLLSDTSHDVHHSPLARDAREQRTLPFVPDGGLYYSLDYLLAATRRSQLTDSNDEI